MATTQHMVEVTSRSEGAARSDAPSVRKELLSSNGYTAVVGILGIGGIVATWFLSHRHGYHSAYGSVAELLVFSLLCTLASRFPMTFLKGDVVQSFRLDDALLVAGMFRLGPIGATIAMFVGVVIGSVWRKLPPSKLAFNIAQLLLTTSAGLCAALLLAGRLDQAMTPRMLGAAIVGAAVYVIVGKVTFASAIHKVNPDEPRASFTDGLGTWGVLFIGGISLGILAAVAGARFSWAPLVALLPVGLISAVLKEQLKARRDRERADALFGATVAAHKSIDTDTIIEALKASTTDLVDCSTARVSSRPPAVGEMGSQLSVTGEREQWLVAVDSSRPKGFTHDDARVLDVLAAVGSTALENARLVVEIKHQAFHDALTGLPNQLLFDDRLVQAVNRGTLDKEYFAVALLDVDDFKKVNDSLGHAVGNELLVQIADRLRAAVRPVDTIARLGADHFTLLFPGVASADTAIAIAEKLHEALRNPFLLSGQRVFVTCTIGMTVFPDDSRSAEQLLKNADAAMHQGKAAGRNTTALYSSDMNAQAAADLQRQTELHSAVRNGELRVFYQPQLSLKTLKIVGVEALVRWQHPDHGLLGPFDFIGIAEQSDLIVEIDRWVLEEACHQAKRWDALGLDPLRIAVNLSGRHLKQADVVSNVVDVLKLTNLSPSRLELEVTEGVTDRETDDNLKKLTQLRSLGVELAIDDFGTGYSGLARLGRFPIDRLKIDRSFIMEIKPESPDAPIVSAMIAMAHSLKLEVIAEGVETIEQQRFLQTAGCEEMQGFLFSKPVPADKIVELMRPQHHGTASAASVQSS